MKDLGHSDGTRPRRIVRPDEDASVSRQAAASTGGGGTLNGDATRTVRDLLGRFSDQTGAQFD